MQEDKPYRPDVTGRCPSLPEGLGELAELMAENVHDTWAAARFAEGWTYGPERNDRDKTHPCLVPYEELPEEEKEYDRNTACSTLRFVIDSGYEIRKKK